MTITYGDVRANITQFRGETKASGVQFYLQPKALMSLKPTKRGMEVRCGSGTLWLTQQGDPVDHFLSTGDTFASALSGLLVVQAMEEATLSIAG